jgi:signal transduction histidine kinase
VQTTTTDEAEGEFSAERAKLPDAAAPAGHRLRSTRRRRPGRAPAGADGTSRTGRGGLRADNLVERLRHVRATQAGFDGETRMRRLLTAVLLSELVLIIVLGAAQAWLGLLVAAVATVVVVAAIMIFGPHDETAQGEGDAALGHIVAGQKEELASLRQRTADAEASSSLLAELASRHRTLLVRQLTQIDQLEAKEADPAALGELFALDHLATRMRRCSEGVLLLSGRDEHRNVGSPVAASEVLRGAVAEVEDFSRVEVSLDRDVEIAGAAVVDVVHLLAELVENATVFSSPTAPVRVRGHVTGEGFAVTVTDEGVGIDPERLAQLNKALSSGTMPVTAGQVGFPVVTRLAARQGVYVGLTAPAGGGIEATVVLPAVLVGGQGAPTPVPSAVAPPPPMAPSSNSVTYAPDGASPEQTYAATTHEQTYQPVAAPAFDEVPAVEPMPSGSSPEAEQSYQPLEPTSYEATSYEPTSYEATSYEPTSYEATPYGDPSYGEPTPDELADPLGIPAVDLDDGTEPELAWAMPAVAHPPQDTPSSWDEPSWTEATEPGPFVPPGYVEDLAPAPLAPLPEPPAVPLSEQPVPVPVPTVEPLPADVPQTGAGLARRIPLTNMAPQIAAPDNALADDVASQPTPDRSRHLFASYRDGLTLGRNGLDDDSGQPAEDPR